MLTVFVSSVAVKAERIVDVVDALAIAGIREIELSGGTVFYPEIFSDLRRLKEHYNLSYLCHNYFPPPEVPFVLNLASLDDEIYLKSIAQVKKAISLSLELGAKKYAFHAGFYADLKLSEIGQSLEGKVVLNREVSDQRFKSAVVSLVQEFGDQLQLYIENNVYSQQAYSLYKESSPFMFTHSKDWIEISGVKPLLDLAHLKVSCRSLRLNFVQEAMNLLALTDYIHVSDNDGISDSNQVLSLDSDLWGLLQVWEISQGFVTLEMQADIQHILENKFCIETLL